MKKSINRIKFFTIALALSVLVFSCNPDNPVKLDEDLGLLGKYRDLGGIMNNLSDADIEAKKGNCEVKKHALNDTSLGNTTILSGINTACFVAGGRDETNQEMGGEVILGIINGEQTNQDAVSMPMPMLMVVDVMDAGETNLADNYAFFSNGNPLDSEDNPFKANNITQLPHYVYLTANQSSWCFLDKEKPSAVFEVVFKTGANVDTVSAPGACDPAVYAAKIVKRYIPNCSIEYYQNDISTSESRARCAINGNTLTVTKLVTEKEEVIINSGDGTVTIYLSNGNRISGNSTFYSITKLTNPETWIVTRLIDDTIQFSVTLD